MRVLHTERERERKRRVGQQFDAANKCCLQFAHTTTSYIVCFTVVRLKRRYKCHKSVFLSGRIKQQMFDSLCGWATSFVNSDLPININGNGNQNEHQSKPDEPVIRSAPPPPRCGCTKERSAKNMLRAATQQKTKTDNRRQQQKRKEREKKNELCRISGSSQHGERSRLRFMQNSTWKKNNRLHGVFIFLPLVRVVMSPVQESLSNLVS